MKPMKTFVQLEVTAFDVPSYVSFRDRWGKVPIDSLSERVLSEMCEQFRAGVFEKAGKRDPKISSVDE